MIDATETQIKDLGQNNLGDNLGDTHSIPLLAVRARHGDLRVESKV